ncbi:hypothetical protein EXW48_22255 [Bacillus wiedmannii]|uniref:hypothetical protein n=1 Tax=Bacillus wiedmannii TaxID=1890302 RepID=UPI001C00CFAA|nr:hypothetical protein [Bacillus wiedmannii]QWI18543.1 hypothetical protein EXW48_22255 [Bacillus wiedmannii]
MTTFQLVRNEIKEQIDDYLLTFNEFSHEFGIHDNELEIYLETLTQNYFSFCFSFHTASKTVYINRAFLPQDLQNKGIALNLIRITFQVAQKYNYNTYVIQIANKNFYASLVTRKARRVTYDEVQITHETKLTK